MSDSDSFSTGSGDPSAYGNPGLPELPRDLPPVEPPSAGLIVQLFLVPAVIVAVIVGVYALFGRLAKPDQDWRQLVVDVRSENPYIRWRGALGLAQMLDADAARTTAGEPLRSNAEIAQALAELYAKLIQHPNPNEEETQQIEFLSKALGRLAVPEKVLPVLLEGMETTRARDVRKHSLIGLAMLAGTMHDGGTPFNSPETVQRLIEVSQESDPLFRQQSAFLLGLFPSQQSTLRLESLLEGGDQMTRLNAAIAFARNQSAQGWPVLRETIFEATTWKLDPSNVRTEEERTVYFERMLMVTNAVKALTSLLPQLDAAQRQQLRNDATALRDSTSDSVLRTSVIELLDALKSSG